MLKSLNVILMVLFISGCSKAIIPETGNQLQVVSYSQFISVTNDVTDACRDKLIDLDMCKNLMDKLTTAKEAIDNDSGTNKASDILNYVRSKL
jgi:uncharacterized protein YceK